MNKHVNLQSFATKKLLSTYLRRATNRHWTMLSFIGCVIVPTIVVAFYYAFIASGQFRSETLFAVRGTTTSPLSLLGLAALPGTNVQAGDAYIVANYIQSKQVLLDVREKQGIDMRSFFSKPEIDAAYRIDPQLSFDEFLDTWNWMADVEFNSTTGITTFRVNAFTAEDAQKISATVLKVAEDLVNRLSDSARQQLISTAHEEVARTEERLTSARNAVEVFRDREQALDPQLVAQSEQTIIRELQTNLADLQARRNALLITSKDSPTLRVLNRQVDALEQQIATQKRRVGSGEASSPLTGDRNLSSVYTDYNALLLEQEFAEKAYTSALTALEQSMNEARKQDRYFAIILAPSLPEVALFPHRLINTLLAAAGFFVLWLFGYLITQSIRDHAI
ncbi:MAG: hypothetical protein ACRECW_17260 [Phyllobacterium sp.]